MKKFSLSSHLLVLLQFSGIFLSLLPTRSITGNKTGFLFLSALGIVLGITTLAYNKIGNFKIYPEIKRNSRLIVTGPYHFIRHPMYTSVILFIAGISFYLNHGINYIGLTGVLAAVILKANREEQLLLAKYPEYKNYMDKTYKFVPFVI